MQEKPAVTSVPIHDLMTRRWSPRAFDANRPVSREQLASLLEAARWAPSCNNGQPWRFLIWDRRGDPAGFEQAFGCLSDSNKAWVKNVPLLMLGCAGSVFEANGRPNRFGQHDTGMAALSIALQAVALGLIAHQMAGFDAQKARELFSVPAEFTPMAMIAIGYQAPIDVLDEETKKKDLASRTRRALKESFFEGRWGQSVRLG